MNRNWEIVNVFLTHNAPDDVYEAWSRIRAEQVESTNSSHNISRDKICADTIDSRNPCHYCIKHREGVECTQIDGDICVCFVGRKLRPC